MKCSRSGEELGGGGGAKEEEVGDVGVSVYSYLL